MSPNDIAVIAMTGRFPNAASVRELWEALCAGRELITRFSPDELAAAGIPAAEFDQPGYVPARGVLSGADLFDAEFFGYSPAEAELIDPQQRLFLECAWEAAEEAGYVLSEHKGRVGMFAATPASTYAALDSKDNPLLVQVGNDVDFAASRVSYKLNLRGPSVTVSSACSSSLVAVHLAAQSLLAGEVELALAGGASVRFPQVRGYRWTPGGILSRDGHCRPFGAAADGTVEANGVAVVLLKLLDQALTDGDPIHAVLKGSAVNNDAADRVGFTAPGVRGQVAVIRDALAFADVEAGSVGYVEAHGTATALGDPIEVRALAAVYGEAERQRHCAIGSLKSNLGHLNHAAGVAGLIKAALCLRYRRLVPSLHAGTLHPDLDMAGGALRVQTQLADWAGSYPRRAAVSSFGMGGTNAHVILEEPPLADQRVLPGAATTGSHPLLLSARTAAALAQTRDRLGTWLHDQPEIPLDAVAFTLQCGRKHFRHRQVMVVRTASDAADALRGRPGQAVRAAEQDSVDRPVAFLFPGQGAQYPRMGQHLYAHNPVFREHLDQCAEHLREPLDGLDVRDVLFGAERPEYDLDQTYLTQPSLFCVEYALAMFWLDQGIEPAAMLGHSVGEYVAACLAGVFSLPVALSLVATRGSLMQRTPVGAMLAIDAAETEVARWLRAYPSLGLCAVNAPRQCVVGGDAAGISALRRELGSAGVPATRLSTNRAFHTAAVEPVLAEFARALGEADFSPPARSFISSVTGTWVSASDVSTPDYWLRQVRDPVRFAAGIATLRRDLDPVFLEVGPGRICSGLATAQGARDAIPGLLAGKGTDAGEETDPAHTLASLWLAGAGIDWARGWKGRYPRRAVLPAYPFERRRHWWRGADAGRPPTPLPSAAVPAARDGRRPVDHWFYQPAWREEPRPPQDVVQALRATEPRWVLLWAGTRVAEGLTEQLHAAGRTVVEVKRDQLEPVSLSAYQRLARDLARSETATRVVHLHGVDPADGVAGAAAAYTSLAFLARSLAETNALERTRLSVVTGAVRPVLGDEPLYSAAAALAGAVTVVPQEYPGAVCDHIEIYRASASALARELASGKGIRVALRGDRRFLPLAAPLDLGDVQLPPSRLRQGGLYVITGGLGRLGLIVADYLARRCAAKLVLLSRRAVPERSHWPAIAADPGAPLSAMARRLVDIEAIGGAVLPIQADVADIGQLRSAIARGRAAFGGPVHGVVHAAGVTDTNIFKLLSESGQPDAEPQLHAKLGGLNSLVQVLDGERPDFVLAFSSLAAVLGGLGFGAYAAANSCLDAAVRLANRNQPGVWSVVNLDGWKAPQEGHGSAFTQSGDDDAKISPEEAGDLFDRVLRLLDIEQTYVSVAELTGRFAQPARPPGPSIAAAARHPRPDLLTRYREPADELEQAVASIWQDLLDIEPIGADDDFFELGGHSLLAMQLVAHVRDIFDLAMPLSVVFQASTVAALSSELATLLDRAGA